MLPTVSVMHVEVSPPVGLAPMAGMTDSAFRRLVKRLGGCGLVVTEMVSAEGLVRGIDRTLEYADYTEEERPVAIQVFGGDPATMAAAAQVVEGMGADMVDINMGCPVPKIARHGAGCSLMREPDRAAAIVRAMVDTVRIPVTVKMRAGWNEHEVNAAALARMVADAGAAGITVHGRTAAQAYRGDSDWDLIDGVAASVPVPVFGSGGCVEAAQIIGRLRQTRASGVLVGRGVLRNPWVFSQAMELAGGLAAREVSLAERGQFLFDYIDLLLRERLGEAPGFRHAVPSGEIASMASAGRPGSASARGRERWVINKLRALASWYTKGLDHGSRLRVAINTAESIPQLRDTIHDFFFAPIDATA